jgi:hypothetical protein
LLRLYLLVPASSKTFNISMICKETKLKASISLLAISVIFFVITIVDRLFNDYDDLREKFYK